jgi:NAD(P)-dependent dehydrogenase (short-subunit alcohol dehydrogenase family)
MSLHSSYMSRYSTGATEPVDRTAVVTGGTSGIGNAVAKRLAKAEYHVVLIGRNVEKGRRAVAEIEHAGGSVEFDRADLSLVADAIALADRLTSRHRRLRLLILNAGGHFADRTVTAEGNEATLAMNVLTPLALARSLRPQLSAGAPSRVVFVSSDAHRFAKDPLRDVQSERSYRGFDVYAKTKLLEVLVARHLATLFRVDGVDVFAANPGAAWTEQTASLRPSMFPLPMRLNWPVMRLVQRRTSAERAALAPTTAALDPGLRGSTGCWIDSNGRPKPPSKLARDADLAREAFEAMSRLISQQNPMGDSARDARF